VSLARNSPSPPAFEGPTDCNREMAQPADSQCTPVLIEGGAASVIETETEALLRPPKVMGAAERHLDPLS